MSWTGTSDGVSNCDLIGQAFISCLPIQLCLLPIRGTAPYDLIVPSFFVSLCTYTYLSFLFQCVELGALILVASHSVLLL